MNHELIFEPVTDEVQERAQRLDLCSWRINCVDHESCDLKSRIELEGLKPLTLPFSLGEPR